MTCSEFTRRQILGGTAGLITWAYQTRIAASSPGRDPRLLVINLRGGMDGIGAVAPFGDPDYHALRQEAALTDRGGGKGLALDGFFVLHPAMPNFHRMYVAGHGLIAHAICSPYRDRSHFDGQDVLESGLPGVGTATSGWLNRALQALEPGEKLEPIKGLAAGPTVPLLLSGNARVMSWMPPGYAAASPDTRQRLLDLYRHTDSGLQTAMEEAAALDQVTGGETAMDIPGAKGADKVARLSAAAVGKLLANPAGPRLGAMELTGWDTHVDGEPFDPRFLAQLGRLDQVLADLKASLGPAWSQTVIVVMTEFGRTIRINGTSGTDHGVGTLALLAGGAVRGGRVVADWPGLGEKALYEGRDLQPTIDIRALFKGVLRDHLGVSIEKMNREVFPYSQNIASIDSLISI